MPLRSRGRHRPTKTEPQTYEMPLVQTWETVVDKWRAKLQGKGNA